MAPVFYAVTTPKERFWSEWEWKIRTRRLEGWVQLFSRAFYVFALSIYLSISLYINTDKYIPIYIHIYIYIYIYIFPLSLSLSIYIYIYIYIYVYIKKRKVVRNIRLSYCIIRAYYSDMIPSKVFLY